MIRYGIYKTSLALCIVLLLLAPMVHGAANLQRNPPECDKSSEDCGCDNGAEVAAACIKVNLDLGETTPWTGSMQCALKIFADSDSPNVFSQLSLYAVLGGYTFKRLGPKNLSDGLTPVFGPPLPDATIPLTDKATDIIARPWWNRIFNRIRPAK